MDQVICACGCGREIIVKSHHKWYGIPKYVNGHTGKGKCCSEEIRRKISEAKKGKHLSEETRRKMSEVKSGKNHPLFGKKHSEETRRKMSEANKGKHRSEETRRKMSEAKKNPSEETRRKLSEANKNPSEETRRKMSEAGKVKHFSEEHKKKISEANKGENNPRFNNWSSRKPYCEKWTEEKREEIRNQYGRKCVICDRDEKDNITKTNKMRKLSVHHVDENKEQGCNGKQWNLKPLCMHCHNSKKMEK